MNPSRNKFSPVRHLSLRPGLRALAAAFNPRADDEGAAAYADRISRGLYPTAGRR